MPLLSEYDRELLFEHIANRVHHDRWVDVSVGSHHWRATLREPSEHAACTLCGEGLTIAHASLGNQLCTRCRKADLH